MPWQVVPSILIIMGAFNVTAAGIWAVDRVYYGRKVSEIECAVHFVCPLSGRELTLFGPSLTREDPFFAIGSSTLWNSAIIM